MCQFVRVKFLGTGEGPLGVPGGVSPETGGVGGVAHVAEKDLAVRKAGEHLRFEMPLPEHPLAEAVSDENDPLALLWGKWQGDGGGGGFRLRRLFVGRTDVVGFLLFLTVIDCRPSASSSKRDPLPWIFPFRSLRV